MLFDGPHRSAGAADLVRRRKRVEVNDYGTVIEADTVRFRRLLPGPIERVWAYLTDPAKRSTWLAGGPMEQAAGGAVELRFRHADLSPKKMPTPARFEQMEDGHTMYGTVIDWQPPNMLSYTWAEELDRSSQVTFELEQTEDQVLLTVTHRRLDGRAEMVSVASGWHAHLDILADRLNDFEPEPFWPRHEAREREYEKCIPRE